MMVVAAQASAELIFDNTTRFLGPINFTALPIGDEVQVSGTGSKVTDLQIGVNQQKIAGTANLQAFLYANDGAGGIPGSLLWQSALMTNVALTGGNDLIDFAVPSIAVPTTFTWAIQISNTQPVAAGVPSFNPPSVGSVLHGWFGGPGKWTNLDGERVDAHFMARIQATTAIPEPSTFVAVCLTLLIGLGWIGVQARGGTRVVA
jgi:hypothetical protein